MLIEETIFGGGCGDYGGVELVCNTSRMVLYTSYSGALLHALASSIPPASWPVFLVAWNAAKDIDCDLSSHELSVLLEGLSEVHASGIAHSVPDDFQAAVTSLESFLRQSLAHDCPIHITDF